MQAGNPVAVPVVVLRRRLPRAEASVRMMRGSIFCRGRGPLASVRFLVCAAVMLQGEYAAVFERGAAGMKCDAAQRHVQ